MIDDDGRFWPLLAVGGLAAAGFVRGSRGVVRAGRTSEVPSLPPGVKASDVLETARLARIRVERGVTPKAKESYMVQVVIGPSRALTIVGIGRAKTRRTADAYRAKAEANKLAYTIPVALYYLIDIKPPWQAWTWTGETILGDPQPLPVEIEALLAAEGGSRGVVRRGRGESPPPPSRWRLLDVACDPKGFGKSPTGTFYIVFDTQEGRALRVDPKVPHGGGIVVRTWGEAKWPQILVDELNASGTAEGRVPVVREGTSIDWYDARGLDAIRRIGIPRGSTGVVRAARTAPPPRPRFALLEVPVFPSDAESSWYMGRAGSIGPSGTRVVLYDRKNQLCVRPGASDDGMPSVWYPWHARPKDTRPKVLVAHDHVPRKLLEDLLLLEELEQDPAPIDLRWPTTERSAWYDMEARAVDATGAEYVQAKKPRGSRGVVRAARLGPEPVPLQIGWLRSGTQLALGEVWWNPTSFDRRARGFPPYSVVVEWGERSLRILGTATTLADARRVLGEAKREEGRILRRWSSNPRDKLRHGPGDDPLIREKKP